jgi:hypothetical protein
MARNQPDDFYDDEEPSIHGSSSSETHGSLGANGLTSADMDLSGMGEGLMGSGRHMSPGSSMSAESAAPKSATSTKAPMRSGSEHHDSPTSMAKKKGNQPR